MRTIFRVETPEGKGAFNGPGWFGPPGSWARHPLPEADGIPYLRIRSEHLFGFANERHARRWFGGIGGHLSDVGYVLSTYEVPDGDVIDGGTQLVFDPARARLVDRRSPAVLDETNDRELVMA